MTAFPHRYPGAAASLHYANACDASARVLRAEGQLREAGDLEAAAVLARQDAAMEALAASRRPPAPHHQI